MKKILLLLQFALLNISVCWAQQPCIGAPQEGHVFVPSPLSCNDYILCFDGNAHPGNCPPNYKFNPITQKCSGVEIEVSCNECGTIGIQNLPYADSCSSYIACSMGAREIRHCPNGLLFDRERSACNYEHLVKCPHNSETPPAEEIEEQPEYPSAPEAIPTPAPEEPTGDPIPDLDNPVCLPGRYFYAHPNDCVWYFICVNDHFWPFQCHEGLHWNSRTNSCDFPENAQCYRDQF